MSTQTRDAQAIAHHYDVSNEFYALFLDPLMVYTCAYYRDPGGTLEQAQADKLELVCRKLRLAPGESLLDIGCGWGSLAIWAAHITRPPQPQPMSSIVSSAWRPSFRHTRSSLSCWACSSLP